MRPGGLCPTALVHALQTAQELHDEVVAELAGLQKQLGIDLGIPPAFSNSLSGPAGSQAAQPAAPQHQAESAPVWPRAEGPKATSTSDSAKVHLLHGAASMQSQQGVMATQKPSLLISKNTSGAESQVHVDPVNIPAVICSQSTINVSSIGQPQIAGSGLLHAAQAGHVHHDPLQGSSTAPGPRQAHDLYSAAPERGSMDAGKTGQCLAPQQSAAEGPDEGALGTQRWADPAGRVAAMPQHAENQQQPEGTTAAALVQQPRSALSLSAHGEQPLNRAADDSPAPESAPGWDGKSLDDGHMTSHPQHVPVASGFNPASAVTPRSSNWSLGDVSHPSLLAEQPSSGWLTRFRAGSLSPGDDMDALLLQVIQSSLPIALCLALY